MAVIDFVSDEVRFSFLDEVSDGVLQCPILVVGNGTYLAHGAVVEFVTLLLTCANGRSNQGSIFLVLSGDILSNELRVVSRAKMCVKLL